MIKRDEQYSDALYRLVGFKYPNKEVIVIYDCTAIMNQYKAWYNSCIPIQFFYGSFY